jgi:phenylacetate-coenzyme A ligase PaaK-like adenylate-forming protein
VIITIRKSPLEAWIAGKIGLSEDSFSRGQLHRYQLERVRETIRWARQHSSFYGNLLRDFAETDITGLADLARLPFTNADDIRKNALRFLCVSQDEINRIVTLDSSGTTGKAKRIYFTASDQELTINYFRYSMAALTQKGDRVLILFPGERPGSLVELLVEALRRLDVQPIAYGLVSNIPAAIKIMTREQVDCVVGIPTQVLALASYARNIGMSFRIKNTILSSDYVPEAIKRTLQQLWGCPVYEYYGMTEMGLGGGTECAALAGCHLYEADLYMEIVDPLTGKVLPEGQEGEAVVTTLTRRGMPLIRYRTGDITRILHEPCECGAIIRRIAKITRRKNSEVFLSNKQFFVMSDLDEAIFTVRDVIDFKASVDDPGKATKLIISVVLAGQPQEGTEYRIIESLNAVRVIRQAREAGELAISVRIISCEGVLAPRAAKRAIVEMKETDG